jgi:tetratricopeptide (TPR) repeat protein
LQINRENLVALNGKEISALRSADTYANLYEAMNFFDRALQIAPDDFTALTLKARALTMSGDYNEAIRIYDKVLKIYPNNHDALYERSVVLDLQEFEIDPSELKCR